MNSHEITKTRKTTFPASTIAVTRGTTLHMCHRRLQIPEPHRVAAEHRVALVRGTRGKILGDHRGRALIVGGERAHRPIRSNHEPLRSKAIERHVEIRPDVGGSPLLPIR